MSMRLAATTAFALLLSGPAFADCKEELNNLDQAAVSAQTGAGSDPGAPMTKHQKEVLGSKQQASDPEVTGSTSGSVKSITPHQEEVTKQSAGAEADQLSRLMMDARKMADAGDEKGCMNKVADLKKMMGNK
jgi:hypothetical protein